MEELFLNQYLREVQIDKNKIVDKDYYPFSLPIIKNLEKLTFHPKVTFITGENGTGKSTLIEAIAVASGFNPEGGTRNFNFSTNDTHSELYSYIKMIKGVRKQKNGFFLRAETFYNVATNVDEIGVGESYGGSLHKKSHGEAFFSTFMNRFTEEGLYILDEPEAALSTSRQMAMLRRIDELVNRGCQFIIATHSPILIAYPRATIYEIKDGYIKEINYEESEGVKIVKDFINNKEKFLHSLLN